MTSRRTRSPASTRSGFHLLGLPLWQGIGAIVGLLGVGVTIMIYLLQSDDKPGQSSVATNVQSGSGNIQAESGNCIIQGGSGNNCQVAPAAPSPAADPLAIDPTWPTIHNCDGGTETAMLPGGTEPGSLRLSPTDDTRTTMIENGGASFGSGHLYLEMTVVDNSTVQIEEIKPQFFKEAAMLPSWVYTPQGGCGDSYSRSFGLDLDRKTFADLGSPTDAPVDASPAPRKEPLGPSFHVSQGDPAEIRIDVSSCKSSYYEWGLRIKYVAGGRTFTKDIGSPEVPFRSVGSGDQRISAYTRGSAKELTQVQPVKSSCG